MALLLKLGALGELYIGTGGDGGRLESWVDGGTRWVVWGRWEIAYAPHGELQRVRTAEARHPLRLV